MQAGTFSLPVLRAEGRRGAVEYGSMDDRELALLMREMAVFRAAVLRAIAEQAEAISHEQIARMTAGER